MAGPELRVPASQLPIGLGLPAYFYAQDSGGNAFRRYSRDTLVALFGALTTLGPSYALRATLYADLNWPANTIGYVWDDGVLSGTYRKNGAVAAGSWTRVGDLPTSDISDLRRDTVLTMNASTGGPTTYAATSLDGPLGGIPEDQKVLFRLNQDCANNPTLNLDALGALDLKADTGGAILAKQLRVGRWYLGVRKTGELWVQVNEYLDIRSDTVLQFNSVTGGPVTYASTSVDGPRGVIPDNQRIQFRLNVDCGLNPTLNLDALGALPLTSDTGGAILAKQLRANRWYLATIIGGELRVQINESLAIRRDTTLIADPATGGPIAYVATTIDGPRGELREDQKIVFSLGVDCANNPTINFDALGALALKDDNGDPIFAKQLRADRFFLGVKIGSELWVQIAETLEVRRDTALWVNITTGGPVSYLATTIDGPRGELRTNQRVQFRLNTDCGANPTINIDGLGVLSMLTEVGAPFAANDLKSGRSYVGWKSGSEFRVVSADVISIRAQIATTLATVNASIAAEAASRTAGLALKIDLTQRAAANGVATLDAATKVPLAQLPGSITSGMHFRGFWNANTNSPALVSSVGTQGDFYRVSVAGSTSINGVTPWIVNDIIAFNGSVWQKGHDALAAVSDAHSITTDPEGTPQKHIMRNVLGSTFAPMIEGDYTLAEVTSGNCAANRATLQAIAASGERWELPGWDPVYSFDQRIDFAAHTQLLSEPGNGTFIMPEDFFDNEVFVTSGFGAGQRYGPNAVGFHARGPSSILEGIQFRGFKMIVEKTNRATDVRHLTAILGYNLAGFVLDGVEVSGIPLSLGGINVASLFGRSRVENCHIHDFGVDADPGYTPACTGLALDSDLGAAGVSDDVTFRNNIIEDILCGGALVTAYGQQADCIKNNRLVVQTGFLKVIGNTLRNAGQGFDGYTLDIVFANNTVEDMEYFGYVSKYDAQRVKVYDNRIRRCGIAGIALTAIGVSGFSEVDIQDADVYGNDIREINPDDTYTDTAPIFLSDNGGTTVNRATIRGNRLDLTAGFPMTGIFENLSEGTGVNCLGPNEIVGAGDHATAKQIRVLVGNVSRRAIINCSGVYANQVGTLSVPNGATYTDLDLATEVFDRRAEFSNPSWTCQVGGTYRFKAFAIYNNVPASVTVQLALFLNGSIRPGACIKTNNAGGAAASMPCDTEYIFRAVPGDVFKPAAKHSHSSALDLVGATFSVEVIPEVF